ncbi:MAG TPA: TolC family protein, partial [Thermodesulfobacteriota bacterium]|nr:TolC family protein [Thermodesulfobacteriota bacterium]
MKRLMWLLFILFVLVGCFTKGSFAQQALTWQQVRTRFLADNPTLQAGRIGIEESRAQEITAHLRPNPNFTASVD